MLQAVCLNPFEKPVIEGISLTIKAEERLDLTAIASVRHNMPRAPRIQPKTSKIAAIVANAATTRQSISGVALSERSPKFIAATSPE